MTLLAVFFPFFFFEKVAWKHAVVIEFSLGTEHY